MKIIVTKNDIEQGVRRNHAHCPIALALKRRFPRQTVSVCLGHAQVGPNLYKLPWGVEDFIMRVDDKLPVEPMAFELNSFGSSQ